METRRHAPSTVFVAGRAAQGGRVLAAEVAVAISYDGATQAVMMASPADLEDFAVGFTLTEGIAAPGDIREIEAVETPQGVDLRIWLAAPASARLAARRRGIVGPVGCGLCGVESLAEAMRPPARLAADGLTLAPGDILAAVAALPGAQPLHDATRAAHAAGFWTPAAGLVAAREDVGRHNALDKLAGALARAGASPQGALVLSSRLSIDLVQKAAALGAPVLIGASAPTSAAVAAAEAAGITLIAPARADRFEVFTRPDRIRPAEAAHVA
jgi:FdhD protein